MSKIKDIPLKEIFSYCDELIESGLEYKWKFRGLRLPQYGLRAVFNCVLNSREYLLTINVYKKGLKEPICEGRVARTLPDRFYFSVISRDIGVEENRIVIKDHIDKFPIFYLKISDLCNGKVLPIDAEPIIQKDIYVKYLRRNQKILRYDNEDYIILPIEK